MHQLDRIEGMLDRLIAEAKPAPVPPDLISAAAVQRSVTKMIDGLIHDKMIDAIKEYRCLTGMGLKESKDAMENLKEHFRQQGRNGR